MPDQQNSFYSYETGISSPREEAELSLVQNVSLENSPSLAQRLATFASLALLLVVGIAIAVQYLPLHQAAETNVAAAAVARPFPEVALQAKSAVVMDISTGEILFALNPDVQLPLASLTKVPLVLVTTEALSLDSSVTLPYFIQSADAKKYLQAGDRWRLQDIVDFTLVSSSNDGAEFLATLADTTIRNKYPGIPAKESAALWRMNALAGELGLRETHFQNVSGLDISPTLAGSYGSARDMAVLFGYAAQKNSLAFSGTARGNVLLTSEAGSQTVADNTNIAGTEIPGLIMGKTGYTDLAGGNLAVVFDATIGHPVAVVVLGSTLHGRFDDVKKLIEATREKFAATQ